MKALFDTNVLVAALIEHNAFHARDFPLLERAKAHEFELFISQHSAAELYRVLTAYPFKVNPSTQNIHRSIEENVFSVATLVELTASDYKTVIQRQAELNNRSGIIFDALIAHAAHKAGVDHLYTFNAAHFIRVWPEGAGIIMEP